MILGISALVRERGAVGVGAASMHVFGGAVGGLVMGFLLWLAATPLRTFSPPPARNVLAITIVGLAVWKDIHFRTRGHGKQVPSRWLARFGPHLGFLLYGAVFGAAFFSHVPYGIVLPVLLVPSILYHDPVLAVTVAGMFGAARALLVAVGSVAPDATSRILYRGTNPRLFHQASSAAALLFLVAVLR